MPAGKHRGAFLCCDTSKPSAFIVRHLEHLAEESYSVEFCALHGSLLVVPCACKEDFPPDRLKYLRRLNDLLFEPVLDLIPDADSASRDDELQQIAIEYGARRRLRGNVMDRLPEQLRVMRSSADVNI